MSAYYEAKKVIDNKDELIKRQREQIEEAKKVIDYYQIQIIKLRKENDSLILILKRIITKDYWRKS